MGGIPVLFLIKGEKKAVFCIKSRRAPHTNPGSNAYTTRQMGAKKMEQIKRFLRGKGFALALLACLVAAGAAGVWAVRAVRNELEKSYEELTRPEASSAP